jgi:hypothetical protein
LVAGNKTFFWRSGSPWHPPGIYKGLPFGLVKVARIILNVAYKQGKPVVTGKDVGYFQVTLYLQESEQFVNRVMVNE